MSPRIPCSFWFAWTAVHGSSTGLWALTMLSLGCHCSSIELCRFLSASLAFLSSVEANVPFAHWWALLAALLAVFGSSEGDASSSALDLRPAPLRNHNMSCYINATLQALAACTSYRQECFRVFANLTDMEKRILRDIDNTWHRSPTVGRDKASLVLELQKHDLGCVISGSNGLLRAEVLFAWSLHTAMNGPVPRSSAVSVTLMLQQCHMDGIQQDAQEFLSMLLDRDVQASGRFTNLFRGEIQSYFRCPHLACHAEVPMRGRACFHILPLQLCTKGSKKLNTLDAAWRAYVEPDLMEESTTWPEEFNFCCPCCGCQDVPMQRSQCEIFPKNLCLQFVRWNYDPIMQKVCILDHDVSVPDEYLFSGVRYILRAVVFHRGASTDSGHYWTCSQSLVGGQASWWYFNDTIRRCCHSAEPSFSSDVLGAGKSYLVLYERVSGTHMPLAMKSSRSPLGVKGAQNLSSTTDTLPIPKGQPSSFLPGGREEPIRTVAAVEKQDKSAQKFAPELRKRPVIQEVADMLPEQNVFNILTSAMTSEWACGSITFMEPTVLADLVCDPEPPEKKFVISPPTLPTGRSSVQTYDAQISIPFATLPTSVTCTEAASSSTVPPQPFADAETESKIKNDEAIRSKESFFYTVSSMTWSESKDPRARRELLVAALAESIRKHPGLPADPVHRLEPWAEALREDLALELPGYHCAFTGCAWVGNTDDERCRHVLEKHNEALQPIANTFSKGFPETLRCLSAYNEVIAEK
eukprot:3088802-Karenia_brevis.AAC.1